MIYRLHDYVKRIFAAYRNAIVNGAPIEYLGLFDLYDLHQSAIDQFVAKYGVSTVDFAAFLGSIGYYSNSGPVKPAFSDVVNEIAATRSLPL